MGGEAPPEPKDSVLGDRRGHCTAKVGHTYENSTINQHCTTFRMHPMGTVSAVS